MSVAGAIVGGIVDSSGVVDGGTTESTGTLRYERITNGGFANGSSWTITNVAWSIAAGIATAIECASLGLLRQDFTSVASGRTVAVTLSVGTNSTADTLTIKFTSAGTPVQTIYSAIPSSSSQISLSVAASSAFDGITFSTGSLSSAITIDNVSVIA